MLGAFSKLKIVHVVTYIYIYIYIHLRSGLKRSTIYTTAENKEHNSLNLKCCRTVKKELYHRLLQKNEIHFGVPRIK